VKQRRVTASSHAELHLIIGFLSWYAATLHNRCRTDCSRCPTLTSQGAVCNEGSLLPQQTWSGLPGPVDWWVSVAPGTFYSCVPLTELRPLSLGPRKTGCSWIQLSNAKHRGRRSLGLHSSLLQRLATVKTSEASLAQLCRCDC